MTETVDGGKKWSALVSRNPRSPSAARMIRVMKSGGNRAWVSHYLILKRESRNQDATTAAPIPLQSESSNEEYDEHFDTSSVAIAKTAASNGKNKSRVTGNHQILSFLNHCLVVTNFHFILELRFSLIHLDLQSRQIGSWQKRLEAVSRE